MFFIYIIHSSSAKKYYVGYSENPQRRLEEHNSSPFNAFTSKFRPWKLVAVFKCGEDQTLAIKMEKFIKKQKSRKLIERLCDPKLFPVGKLAQLVRISQE